MIESLHSWRKRELARLLEEKSRRLRKPLVRTAQSSPTAGNLIQEPIPELAYRSSALLFPNRYVPHAPFPNQQRFLDLECEEALYGGAAGGGKSDAILMDALQYIDCPGYAALILRRTYADLSLPGALMDRAHDWLQGSGAQWDSDSHTWKVPGKGSLTFGYCEIPKHKYRYQGAEFQYIGFDELTQFEEADFTYLKTRLRRLADVNIPLKIRGASNPGGLGHAWVKQRFITEGPIRGRVFVPSKVRDNIYLDRKSYEHNLSDLPEVLRLQLLEGNWDVTEGGKVVSRAWFTDYRQDRPWTPDRVRAWDLAATSEKEEGCRTAGVLLSREIGPAGKYVVEHVVKGFWRPGDRDKIIESVAKADGKGIPIVLEQEPGSGGIAQNEAIARMLPGWATYSIKSTGDKVVRAGPFSSEARNGQIALIRGEWLSEYLDELDIFPDGAYGDQMDATTLAYNWLAARPRYNPMPELPIEEYWDDDNKPHSPWDQYKTSNKKIFQSGYQLHGDGRRTPYGTKQTVR